MILITLKKNTKNIKVYKINLNNQMKKKKLLTDQIILMFNQFRNKQIKTVMKT